MFFQRFYNKAVKRIKKITIQSKRVINMRKTPKFHQSKNL
jgi:hypothetical protein